MAGAAPAESRSWLLLEHPGPWPARPADPGGVLPERVREAADEHGLRIQLIRRHGGGRTQDGLACYLGHSGYDTAWLEHRRLSRPAEALTADLASVAAGRMPGFGARVEEPVALVCTHGARDACCAELGRPVAAALDEADLNGATAWESSHVGGHRFAANLVMLPRGLSYGRLSPAGAVRAVREAAHGRVVAAVLRGRPGRPAGVQAAEIHVRQVDGLAVLDGLSVTGWQHSGPEEQLVELAGPECAYRVRMRVLERTPRPVSCGTEETETPIRWLPVELTREPGQPADENGFSTRTLS